MKQRTIKKSVETIGIGLHKGEPIKMRLEPLEANSGIVFYRSDLGVSIELKPENVVDTQMATVIGKDEARISTIEHFLSCIYAYGVDNMRISVDNNELPILDGSSIGYCMLLDEAGVIEQSAAKKVLVVTKEIEVKAEHKYTKLTPHDQSEFDFRIKFEHPVIKEQHYSFEFSKENYLNEIAKARTFGFLRELNYLNSKGLALGASVDNVIGLDDTKVLNSEGLRFPDEFVRHKILDAIGDMSLLGMPLIGKYESFAGSHHLNHLLTVELLKNTEAYKVVELEEESEEALEYALNKVFD
jgi:UDP-3-O-[3-hydroxymyristoyl] N-acetylglucosamine deacetylase